MNTPLIIIENGLYLADCISEGYTTCRECVIGAYADKVNGEDTWEASQDIGSACKTLRLYDKDCAGPCARLAKHMGLFKTPRENFMERHNKNLENT